MAIGEVIRLAAHFTHLAGSVGMMVFWYEAVANVSDEDTLAELGAHLLGEILPRWAEVADADAQATHADVDVVNLNGTVDRNLGVVALSLDGDISGQVMPAGVAAMVQAYTNIPTSRGKKYLPYISEATVDEGYLNAGALTSLALFLLEYLLVLEFGLADSWRPGVLSRTLEEFVAFDGSGSVTDVPAYQRRRKPNVGS
jgi:hypothetical protein